MLITILAQAAKEATTLSVASKSLNPAGVTRADVVGGVDEQTVADENAVDGLGFCLERRRHHRVPAPAGGQQQARHHAQFGVITATVLADGTEVVLDQQQASDMLNANGITTAINMNGFKSWGNKTAAYPSTTDPKDMWFSVRRFFDWDGNNFIRTYFQKVDKPGNKRLIRSIVDSQNIVGNGYVARDYCAGYRLEFLESENPATNLINGHLLLGAPQFQLDRLGLVQHVHGLLVQHPERDLQFHVGEIAHGGIVETEYLENIREFDVAALTAALTA